MDLKKVLTPVHTDCGDIHLLAIKKVHEGSVKAHIITPYCLHLTSSGAWSAGFRQPSDLCAITYPKST